MHVAAGGNCIRVDEYKSYYTYHNEVRKKDPYGICCGKNEYFWFKNEGDRDWALREITLALKAKTRQVTFGFVDWLHPSIHYPVGRYTFCNYGAASQCT